MEDKIKANYEIIDIDSLIPYARNSKVHSEKQIAEIAASINEYGFLSPLVIDKDNTILCGNGRYYAALKLGLKRLPCIKEEYLTDSQRRAYVISDNKIGENATWDEEMLKVEIEDLKLNDFNIDLLGFSDKELAFLFKEEKEVIDDDYDLTSALEKEAFVKRGDIWYLGPHKLMCGDSTTDDVKTLMGDFKADLVITDAPYGVSLNDSNKKLNEATDYNFDTRTILNDNLKGDEFSVFLKKAFKNIYDAMKSGAALYEFFATREHIKFEQALIENKLTPRQELIWHKNTFTLGRQDYQWDYEPIFYSFKDGKSHSWYSDRKQRTVLEFNKQTNNTYNPCQKPLDLIGYLMNNSSKSGDLVLDIFGGSGSTLITAEKLDRVCYTMELDPKYASAIVRRYVDDGGNVLDITCLREGKTYTYSELVKDIT